MYIVRFINLRGLNKSDKKLMQGRKTSCFESQNYSATKCDMKMISAGVLTS